MELKRTTVRLEKNIMRKAKEIALKRGTSLQGVFNSAVIRYLLEVENLGPRRGRRLKLMAKPLGLPDNLTRDDMYD